MGVVIEFLRFKVEASLRESYIHKDAEIWTTALAKYPGFLGKEVWTNPLESTEVIFIIYWETKEHWKTIPAADLEAIEQRFKQAVGDIYELVEFREYQVRKFLHN
ncbi:conserved hypothetical protein [Trichormus variabilis ATCC 29413]|uniref:ABM domain-containing protein n=2 Tax=Anabaena variabilis TaxID=264691 RepID=Q3MGC7_TRIV2|nr:MULTISPECIES: TIGR03792 family protein [Nostocaceae]ABA19959.1 conserved hypothetical protein [Trichormus variabilis ATCC 29413]MBC1213606.1 TIGR03792 family protein [Trichormus variabilis ARAD]MBC1255484.1 TIGR03792 family protein [Trichormus variabilis V5]MBC1266515.1 TIGR03792 family protein [Trichormus variabilis FSR]MBC1302864.1 TIGR03792 family protein [Trichormus variabilis N2B]